MTAVSARSAETAAPPPRAKGRAKVTAEDLAARDGNGDPSLGIWLAVKGVVFDVSANRAAYGPGGSYAVFAGKDASRALGKSSLKPEDCVADYSVLTESELKVLDDWLACKWFRLVTARRPTFPPFLEI
ncbi:MAG: cytochrome b5-like heme/steroid binding domain-containing protein [Olpidium bornovanus]|uniref:Cytochrome b5-like heme/steroid binding domain-containing protein n=1 Tax=Olpidium bornovanus TaxID=278681 RepID=A0A8H7ZSE0_9FUNG|nr:MAG: cytochrome b5-like heme/steroid binding domain-containing protein [Olpidium bornovanus]